MAIAAEHLGEGIETLRLAAAIPDPYKRADAIWEAIVRIRSAGEYLWGPKAVTCEALADALEAGCNGRSEPPAGAELLSRAAELEAAGRWV
jgi:hypothetical protein